MRYYAIVLGGADPSVFPLVPGSEVAGAQFSSTAYDKNDPGALRVVMRIEYEGHLQGVLPQSFIRIMGVSLDMLKQASDLNGKSIDIYGGFYPGLPLATYESQFRHTKLFGGKISQGFGNWEGQDMSLDLFLTPGTDGGGETGEGASSSASPTPSGQGGIGAQRFQARRGRRGPDLRPPGATPFDALGDIGSIAGGIGGDIFGGILSQLANTFGGGSFLKQPLNLIHNLLPNMPLSGAIQQTLQTAFSWASVEVNIMPSLVLAYHDSGFYQSAEQAVQYWNQLSKSINKADDYHGVDMFAYDRKLLVTDLTSINGSPGVLLFEDLIGQPTWSSTGLFTFKTVMRPDLQAGNSVTMPQQVLQAVTPAFNNFDHPNPLTLTFANGTFPMVKVTHSGDSRHSDGANWCTQVVCNATESNMANIAPKAFGQLVTNFGSGGNINSRRQVMRY